MMMARSRARRQIEPTFVRLHRGAQTDYEPGPTAMMFVEDIKNTIMPFRFGREPNDDYQVSIVGSDESQVKLRSLLESLGNYRSYSVEEQLSLAIEAIASHLAWQGEATYEILEEIETNEVLLSSFSMHHVYKLPGHFIQVLPKLDREYYGRRLMTLSRDKVWRIQMPAALGGRRGHLSTLRMLRRYPSISPKCYRDELEKLGQLQNYNFMEYVTAVEIYHYRATRRWGWDHRDMRRENTTEFFRLVRKLRFRWAQSILRNHILTELNALAERLKIPAEISVTGLQQPDEILRMIASVYDGEMSFDQAYQRGLNVEL